MASLAADPALRHLLPEGAALNEALARELGVLRWWNVALDKSARYRELRRRADRLTGPSSAVAVGLRKRFFDEETRAAIEQGAAQVLSLGAGLDGLCLRLASRYPEVTFVELDHPATQALKRSAVEKLGAGRPNLHLFPLDLQHQDLEAELARVAAWRTAARSVVIAEGVLMYLDEPAVGRLLASIARICAPGSCFLFTYLAVPARERRAPLARFLALANRVTLRLRGEPYRWVVRAGDLERVFAGQPYRLDRSPERCDLRRRYLEPEGLRDLAIGDAGALAIAETIA
ncbi:MAG: class I SAM-dependent methyltransferase [Deltaproteobacteria bacterium]|nr:class I SAM-dependent methyltransferase [Deltaproteobacteria bacterium]